MSERFTLPIRRWLALALVVTLCLPLSLTVSVAASRVRGPWNGQIDAVRLLRDDAARWNDPAWQSTMRDRLAGERIAFVLYDGEHEIYRSTADPIGATQFHSRTVQRIVVPGASDAQTALIYSD